MDNKTRADCARHCGDGPAARLNPAARCLSGSSGEVHLTGRESSVLQYLAQGAGPYSREVLYRKAFGRDWCPTDRSLDVHVAHLRAKLKSVGLTPPLIDSIRSRGYLLRAKVCINKGCE